MRDLIILFLLSWIVMTVLEKIFIKPPTRTFRTYDGRIIFTPYRVYTPLTLDELVKTVKKGGKIRVSGGHHTFNDISLSNDKVIRMENLNKVIKIDKNQVTVEAGITLMQLNKILEQNKLSLHILPAIPYQTIGGIVATSTHGSRLNKGSISSAIIDITLVLANGTIKKFTKKDKDFSAMITSLGALGAIYSVTFECEPFYKVKHVRQDMSIEQFIKSYKKLIKDNVFTQCYIWPFRPKNKQVVVYIRGKTDEKINPTNKPIREVKSVVDAGHKVLTKNEEIRFYTEIEIAVDVKNLEEVIQDTVNLFEQHKKHGYVSNMPFFLVRFTGNDNSLLGMTAGRDSVFLDLFDTAENSKNPKVGKFFSEFEEIMIEKFRGRPHYGKRHELTHQKMGKIYGDNVEKFNRIREKYDPNKVFSNKYTNRLLLDSEELSQYSSLS